MDRLKQVPALIRSGPAEVLSSGSVIAFRGHEIDISVPLEEGDRVRIVFHFIEDQSSEARIEWEGALGTLHASCINFTKQKSLTGTASPSQLGRYVRDESGRRPIFVHFRTLALQGGDIMLFYTFYAGEADENA